MKALLEADKIVQERLEKETLMLQRKTTHYLRGYSKVDFQPTVEASDEKRQPVAARAKFLRDARKVKDLYPRR